MKIPRWLSITLILLFLIITVVTLFYTITDWRGAKQVQAAKATLQDRGEPLTFDQLQAGNPGTTPPALANLLEDSHANALKDRLPAPLDLPQLENDPEPAAWKAALEQLTAAEAVMVPLIEATQTPVAWPYDLSDPVNTTLPQISLLNRMVRLLRVQAEAGMALDRPALTLESLQTLMRLRQWVAYPLTLIEALTGFSIDHQILEIIREGIVRDSWPAEDLARLERVVQQLAPLELLRRGLRGERIFFVTITEDLSKDELAMLLRMAVGDSMPESQFSRGLAALALYPQGWLDADRADYALEIQRVLDRLQQISVGEAAMGTAAPLKSRSQDRHPLTQMVRATIDDVINRGIALEAQRRLTLIGLALEQHRVESGSYPASLDLLPLTNLLRNDPAAGESFEYKATESGYSLSAPETGFYREQDRQLLEWER